MFVFKKKSKPGKQIDYLLSLLEKDPENTKALLKLADLYLRAGDKKSAIKEYQTAARYLSGEGFNLKAISVYKKLLALDGMTLSNYKSLASLYASEGLRAEATRTCERILQIDPYDREARETLDQLEKGGNPGADPHKENNPKKGETQAQDDSDPVPIEALLSPSQDQETGFDPSSHPPWETLNEMDLPRFPDDSEMGEEGSSPDSPQDSEIDIRGLQLDGVGEADQFPHEKEPNDEGSPYGKLLRDLAVEELAEVPSPSEGIDGDDLSDAREEIDGGLSSESGQDSVIDIGDIQVETIREADDSFQQKEPDREDPLHGEFLRDLRLEELSGASPPSEEVDTPPPALSSFDSAQPSPFDTPTKDTDPPEGDPSLHYDLGVAYRQMELTDRAIEEFTKALEQGTKLLECLIMLARCHFEKGLFEDAARFIHRALKLNNLTQEQIDLLYHHLEEVEAVGKPG